MKRGTAVLVVGHADWGKSQTLRALTKQRLTRSVVIESKKFVVKRMSNDDNEAGLMKFCRELDPHTEPYVIIALCPKLTDRDNSARAILTVLARQYRVLSWVQHERFGTEEVIPADQIRALRAYGMVRIFRGQAAANRRANDLRDFIERYV